MIDFLQTIVVSFEADSCILFTILESRQLAIFPFCSLGGSFLFLGTMKIAWDRRIGCTYSTAIYIK